MNDQVTLTHITIARETDQSVWVEIQYALADGAPRAWKLWLPKSDIALTRDWLAAPAWLLEQKFEALPEGATVLGTYRNGDIYAYRKSKNDGERR